MNELDRLVRELEQERQYLPAAAALLARVLLVPNDRLLFKALEYARYGRRLLAQAGRADEWRQAGELEGVIVARLERKTARLTRPRR